MRINYLPTLLLFLAYPCVSYTKEIHIQGLVFRDLNQNGTKDLQEPGVGGIRLLVNEHSFYTDEQGIYSKTIDIEEDFESVVIDEEKLPAGSRLTTPASFVLNKNNLNFSNANFGLTYRSESITFPKKETLVQEEITRKGFVFEVKDHSLYINQVAVLNFPRSLKHTKAETTRIILNDNGELTDKKKLEVFLERVIKQLKNNEVTEVSIEVAMPIKDVEDTQKLNQVASRLEDEIRKALPLKNFKRELGFKGSYLDVSASIGTKSPNQCRIYYGTTTFEVDHKKTFRLDIENQEKMIFQAECPGKVTKLDVQIFDQNFIARVDKKTFGGNIHLSEEVIVKNQRKPENSSELIVEQNLHLERNRDRFAHFYIKSSGLKLFTVNGRKYRSSDLPQNYLYSGKAGKNTLRFSMIDLEGNEKTAKHEFNLFQYRKFYLAATIDSYDLRSRSSRFDFNYDIPSEKRVNIQSLYFLDQKWGIHFNHLRDITNSTTELAGGGTKSYQRTETQLHGIYRFKILNSDYFAPMLHLYGGLQIKDAGLPSDALLHFPKSFKGLSLGAELLKENFFTTQVASSSSIFAGYENADNRTLRFTQEFRVNLNHIGKLFKSRKEHIYGPTYKGWNNVRLVVGMNYEIDEREAENVNAMISDKAVAYRLGLAIQI